MTAMDIAPSIMDTIQSLLYKPPNKQYLEKKKKTQF